MLGMVGGVRWVALAAAVLLVLFGAVGCGGGKVGGPSLSKRAIFDGLDKNRDGKLSAEEYYSLYKSKNDSEGLFTQYDSNGDGFLDYNEFHVPGNAVIRW